MYLPKILKTISQTLTTQNAKAIVVGGSVRDHFLGLESKDYDVEVYGLETIEELEQILTPYGRVNLVGKSFGVLKFSHAGEEYDFSFPRRESKVSAGHRGFDIVSDGSMSYEDAARRRDFTLNSIGYSIEEQVFLDPYDGMKDISLGLIRHIDDDTFVEDPLRVYRAVQFCARFEFELESSTLRLCGEMVSSGMLEELPKERIYTEYTKLLLKSPQPSKGFELMHTLGVIERHYPELYSIIGVPQSPKWHPEGDVWIHTMMALDAMKRELDSLSPQLDKKQRLRLLFAILCHDLGKATHTTIEDGEIRSIGHEGAGVEPTKSLLYRLTDEHSLVESILPLVEHHLKPSQFYSSRAKSPAIRRLATKVNIEELVIVAKADFLGRTTQESRQGIYPAGEWLLERASELNIKDKATPPLLQGRDLIALGINPSPKFGQILKEIYESQLDGEIGSREEALEWVREMDIITESIKLYSEKQETQEFYNNFDTGCKELKEILDDPKKAERLQTLDEFLDA